MNSHLFKDQFKGWNDVLYNRHGNIKKCTKLDTFHCEVNFKNKRWVTDYYDENFFNYKGTLSVVDTDYENYAVVHSHNRKIF